MRDCLNDLVGIMALPALSTGGEPGQIVSSLVDALLGTLRLAFVCVRLNDPGGGPAIEVVRVDESLAGTARERDISEAIDASLGQAPVSWPPRARVLVYDTELCVASARLGLQGEIGVVVAGSRKRDFPADTERLLLDVAANQAAIGLQQVRLLSEQKRLASDLAERVARRTSELAATNERLKNEVAERRRTEDALRANELNFQLTVDSIPGMVHTMTATGAVEFVNHQILDFFGKTLEELNNWAPLVHPDDRARVIDLWTRSVATGEPFDVEHRVLGADGTYRWLHARGLPLRDISGNIVRWYNLLTDIDERKCAEDALRESERESRLIVDSIPGLVALLGATGDVEVVNRRVFEYFGQTLEELRQWGTNDTIHPEDLPHVIEVFMSSIASGSPYEIVQRFRRSDGVYRWFLNSGFPLRDPNGHIVRWCVLLTDIDERQRAEDAVRASERNLKLIIDTIPALAWSARPDGSAEFFNQHYLDFMGMSAEQAGDWGWTAAVHPEDLNGVTTTWRRIIASGAPGELEARLRRHDGTYRWFLFRANPLRDESGVIVKWYGTHTDIDDRKRAEEALRRSEAFLVEGQHLARLGNFAWNLATGEIAWSEQVYRMFEFEPGTRMTLDLIASRVHPEDMPILGDMVERAQRGVSDFEYEHRLLMPDQSVKHLHLIAHRTRDEQGPLEYIGAVQDVTQRRRAEEALNKARSELAHVARVTTLGALTASMAHEVNQPLSGIITNAGTCLRMLDADPPNLEGARETARRTIRDGNRAADVITRLRALFSKKEFTLELLDLNEATREVIALSLSDLQRNRVVLHSELADDLPIVTGDRIQLQQVILNLLRNASDAMVTVDDRPRQLLIKTEREDGGHVRMTVRDAGIGLPTQGPDTLFDAFYTTKSGGMGIGLFISRSIVERHHGRLWAEPNDGPGASFAFSIPLDPAGDGADVVRTA